MYATPDELAGRLGASVFAEIYGEGSAADDLASASAEIDGAAGTRYRVPLTGEGALALAKDWCLTLAEERAYARAAGSAWAEKVKSRVDQVRHYLQMVREGSFPLPGAAENPARSAAFARTAPPVFGREKMKDF